MDRMYTRLRVVDYGDGYYVEFDYHSEFEATDGKQWELIRENPEGPPKKWASKEEAIEYAQSHLRKTKIVWNSDLLDN